MITSCVSYSAALIKKKTGKFNSSEVEKEEDSYAMLSGCLFK